MKMGWGQGVLWKKRENNSPEQAWRRKGRSGMDLWAVDGAFQWPGSEQQCYKCCLRS